MGFTTSGEYKLKYEISGENSKLKAAVADSEKQFGKLSSSTRGLQKGAKEAASEVSNIVSALTGDRLTGAASQVTSLAEAFGAIPGPAGLAVGVIAGIGVAAAAAGEALFELTKKATEYGESIYNAQVKTGLHAETLSAMELAAKQSGVGFDQVTGSIQKFAQTVGQAAEGSDKAGKMITALGLDPKTAADNLDASLAKVLKRIADAPTTVEKNTLAFQAFGKQGKELLPFIERFHGDLPELTRELEKMGVTIGDKDALAAHQFGEQLSLVEDQVGKVAIKMGIALIPTANRLASAFSDFFTRNQTQITEWADKFAFFVDRVVAGAERVVSAVESIYHGYASFMQSIGLGFVAKPLFGFFDTVTNDYNNDPAVQKAKRESTGYGGSAPGGDFDNIYGKTPKVAKDQSYLEMKKFFESMGAYVTDAKRAVGSKIAGTDRLSKHGTGEAVDVRSRGVSDERIAEIIAKALEHGYRVYDERHVRGIDPHLHFETNTLKASTFGSAGDYGSVANYQSLLGLDAARRTKASGSDALTAANKKSYDEDFKNWTDLWQRKTDLSNSFLENIEQQQEAAFEKSKEFGDDPGAFAAAQKIHDLKVQLLDDEIEHITERYNKAAAGSKEEADLYARLTILDLERDQKVAAADTELDRRQQEIADNRLKRDLAQTKLLADQKEKQDELTASLEHYGDTLERIFEQENKQRDAKGDLIHPGPLHGLTGDESKDPFQQLHDHFKDKGGLAGDLGVSAVQAATEAFSQLGEAVGSAVQAFVLYGSAGASVRQVTAQILASIAQQAAVQAIYELAQGLAVLALAFFGVPNAGPSATAHFAAAAMYGVVAGVTAIAGRGVAGNSFKNGGGGTGAPGSPGSTGSYNYNPGANVDKNPTPYSRHTDNYYESSRDRDRSFFTAAIDRHTQALEKIHDKMASMKPEEVMSRAFDRRPGSVGQQVVKDIKSNSNIGTAIMRHSGVK